jgi:catechol 2,3-dioxygenase-like lactoylglutathione lyase family enzyme
MSESSENTQTWMTGLDHPVIAVRDMTAARAAYERLGFTIPPRGSHVQWGTGNWCIMFPRDYIELRGIVKEGHTHNLGEFLATRGEGLMGLALGTQDAGTSRQALVERGFHPQPVKGLTRNFELADGWVQPRFSLCFFDEAETAGIMSVVYCHHLTPELLRRPEWLEHANGAVGVAGLTGVVEDVSAAAETHRRWFGESAVSWQDDDLHIRVGKHFIRLMTADKARQAFPEIQDTGLQRSPRLLVLTLRTNDFAKSERFLSSQKVPFRETSNSLIVEPAAACGVTIEFTRQANKD